MFCKNCGEKVNENQSVCLKCGASVNPANSILDGNIGGQNKLTIALVCFFLGGLGIHNFMLGENKKGIIKIIMSCLCGIGAILALVDFIKILTDKYVIDPNASF